MPDYSKGKIYTIRNRDDDTKIYVGSTIQSLAVRFGGHKDNSKKQKCVNYLLYKEVDNDWTNWYIELYENYSCSSREELLKKEGEVIRLIGTLNKVIPGRTRKEYTEDNAEKLKEYKKQYYEEHIEKYKEKNKQYRNNNKDDNKEYMKKYYEENKEKKKEYDKIYREKNAEKIKEYKKQYSLKKKEEKSQESN